MPKQYDSRELLLRTPGVLTDQRDEAARAEVAAAQPVLPSDDSDEFLLERRADRDHQDSPDPELVQEILAVADEMLGRGLWAKLRRFGDGPGRRT